MNQRGTSRRKHRPAAPLFTLLLAALVLGAFALQWALRGAGPDRPPSSTGLLTGGVTGGPADTTRPEYLPLAVTSQPGEAGEDRWNLVLVNPWTPLPEDYEVTLTKLKSGQSVDERCYPDLQEMMDACRAAGLSPLICSSYRTWEKQESLFRRQAAKWTAKGYSEEDAKAEAGKTVAVPGTSEHQLGLALDIVDVNNQNLTKDQENTAVQKWLLENSWKYGFILRYPNDKSAITGIIYEPWHYRYVGRDAAKEIYEQGSCLEEYLELQSTANG